MFDKSKLIILVTGTTIQPYDKNWKECESTWMPELRNLGYTVKVAIGNPKMNKYVKEVNNIVYFAAEDTKRGLFDKSIRLPCRWILEETNYEYYFRIDSDSFVNPHKFDNMIQQNLSEEIPVDYMGCCHPANHVNPFEFQRFLICKKPNMASGCGYMVSRKAMKIAYDKMRIDDPIDYEIDDWVLGRAMWENEIPLLHDSRILFESNYKVLSMVIGNVPLPDIADPNSHLALQHYMDGHMEEAMVRLGYRN